MLYPLITFAELENLDFQSKNQKVLRLNRVSEARCSAVRITSYGCSRDQMLGKAPAPTLGLKTCYNERGHAHIGKLQ